MLGAYGAAMKTRFGGFGTAEAVIVADEPMASLYTGERADPRQSDNVVSLRSGLPPLRSGRGGPASVSENADPARLPLGRSAQDTLAGDLRLVRLVAFVAVLDQAVANRAPGFLIGRLGLGQLD